MNIKEAEAIVGGLSKPSKMPGFAYSIPAAECNVGSQMHKVKGSTCEKCYALKGRYAFPMVQSALYRRLEALKDPRWVAAMVFLINKRKGKHPFFRWHDSGDLQSVEHLELIAEVCRQTPNVKHWIPTREYVKGFRDTPILQDWLAGGGVIPSNLTVRLSALMNDTSPPKAIAERLGVQTSNVSSSGAFTCPASNQGNECGDCRACWDRSVKNVTYKIH
jgi:hypothetical protein